MKKAFYWAVMWFIKFGLYVWTLIYYRYKITGKKNLKRKPPYLIALHHSSHSDMFVLNMAYPARRFHIMTGQHMFKKNCFLTIFLHSMGVFKLDLKDGSSAIGTASDILKRDKILAMLPEGTVSKDGKVSEFKAGVIRVVELAGGDIPIIPAFINKRKSKWHRQKIVFGEQVFLKDLCEENADLQRLTSEQMKVAAGKLRGLVCELKEENEL